MDVTLTCDHPDCKCSCTASPSGQRTALRPVGEEQTMAPHRLANRLRETAKGVCSTRSWIESAKTLLLSAAQQVDALGRERDAACAQADEWRKAHEHEQGARIATEAARDGWRGIALEEGDKAAARGKALETAVTWATVGPQWFNKLFPREVRIANYYKAMSRATGCEIALLKDPEVTPDADSDA